MCRLNTSSTRWVEITLAHPRTHIEAGPALTKHLHLRSTCQGEGREGGRGRTSPCLHVLSCSGAREGEIRAKRGHLSPFIAPTPSSSLGAITPGLRH